MTKLKKRLILAALIAVETLICALILVSLVATQARGSSTRLFYWADTYATESIEERFAVDGPASLELDNLRGDVEIVAGEGSEYVIQGVKEVWGQGQEDAQARLQGLQVAVTHSGGRITVQVLEPPQMHVLSIVNRGSVVSFRIAVPRQSDVRLSTRDGVVLVRDLEGDLQIENRFGPVQIEDVTGTIAVDARDRDVTILRSGDRRAELEIHNRFGDLTLRDVTASQVQIENRDGDVTLESLQIGGPLRVDARFGMVDLEDVTATDVEVTSDNDAISFRNVQASGRLVLEHKFGQVSLYNVAGASLHVNTQDGTVSLDEVVLERELSIETRFSSVDVSRCRAQELSIQASDRDVELDHVQLEGELQVTGRHGSVRVSKTTAREYRIETRDGPIELEGASGLLWLRNSFGDITVTDAHEATLDAETRDGDFFFEGQLSGRTGHRIDCETGDVTLRLPADTALWLEANTRPGRIDNELAIDAETPQDGPDEDRGGTPDEAQLEGAINGGKTKLRIKVRDGNISLETD